ncbi:hypothetical protein H5410_061737 [Solanum commersonii]|uniref:Uncharacterized protein n=1 Tax=Solanum commersonii TaxID=4109 RepID=A0A9J5W8I8_SOLCO|nr:hypothetical protein H5410_061737 [Solanum commersonii]
MNMVYANDGTVKQVRKRTERIYAKKLLYRKDEGGAKFDSLIEHWLLVTGSIPNWWRWGFLISPFSYGLNALTINKMFAQRWMGKYASDITTTLGIEVMKNFYVFHEKRWFWIGTVALLGFTILFNILLTFAVMYLNRKPQDIISKEQATNVEGDYNEGDIRILGFPKKPETFARVSVSQNEHTTKCLCYILKNKIPNTINMVVPRRTKALVKKLCAPPPGAKYLYFRTKYSQSAWGQFKSCLWKEWWTHWRSPNYNLVRFFFSLAAGLIVGTIFYKVGSKRFVSITGLSKLKWLKVYAVGSGEGIVYIDFTPTL